MKIIETPVYDFNELSDNAKEKARAWFRAGDEFDGEYVIEEVKELLAFAGWGITKVYFSGFFTPGDGACFEGTWSAGGVDIAGLVGYAPLDTALRRIVAEHGRVAKKLPTASATVRHSGRYYHEYCADFLLSDEFSMVSVADFDRAERDFLAAGRRAMRWVYGKLEEEYEYQRSDKYADDTIEANGYTFTASGKREG